MTRSIRGLAAAGHRPLAGCAGTNFKRPEPQDLVVGKSNAADIQRVMGGAQQTGEGLQNEQKVQTLRYAYAEGAGQGRYPGWCRRAPWCSPPTTSCWSPRSS